MVKKKDDEDISIDFGKIKTFFSSKKENKKNLKNNKNISNSIDSEEESTDFSLNYDTSKLFLFLKKYGFLLLLLIPIILTINLRIQPASLPITDDWAENTVNNYYRNLIYQEVNREYPTLPEANKQRLLDDRFNEFYNINKDQIDSDIKQTSLYFKSRLQDETGLTYFTGIDPYFWMLKTENVINHGYMGDTIIDGKQWDKFMLAPIGRAETTSEAFHPYFQAYLYKFMNIFNNDVTPRFAAFYGQVVLMVLAIIVAFILGMRIAGPVAGLVTSMVISFHPSILGRTIGGFADTDPYQILFPLMIVLFIFEAIRSKTYLSKIIFTILASFICGLFSFAWGGWWFIVDFMIVLIFGYLILRALVLLWKSPSYDIFKDFELKSGILVGIIFIVSTIFFVSAMKQNIETGYSFIKAPLDFMLIKEVGVLSVWPNVYTTVAELNEIPLNQIMSYTGKPLFFFFVLGLIFLVIHFLSKVNKSKMKKEIKTYHLMYFILAVVWVFATVYASTKGIRFVMLLIPGLAIGIGIFAGYTFKYLSSFFRKELELDIQIVNFVVKPIIALLLFVLIFVFPYNLVGIANTTAKSHIPIMDDAWWNSLEKIKNESQPDAIINSWWDFGHQFKYVAKRGVTFDGASQNTPMAHWIGLALLTDDEDLSIGILRMLDCRQNEAFEELNKIINQEYKTIDLLYEIVREEKDSAKRILKNNSISEDNINLILSKTHCEPPENYFIVSGDMIGKAGVWGHFGSWDFRKATQVNRIRNLSPTQSMEYLKNEYGYSDEKAESVYYDILSLGNNAREIESWIAPWPSFVSERVSCTNTNTTILSCQNGAVINLEELSATVPIQGGRMIAESLVYIDSKGFNVKEYNDLTKTIPYSVILIPTETGFDSIVSSPETAKSMFTRLYFFDGHGLDYFKKFSHERSFRGEEIIVYNVSWAGGTENVFNVWSQKVIDSEEIRAKHILVNNSESAEDILFRLKAGEDFSEIAYNESICSSAQLGGDLGYFAKGSMIPAFENEAFLLSLNEISDIVETEFGYHIITVTDRRNVLDLMGFSIE
jgi:dolichyl-phosphooligosaccharide-protein glycotransferase